MTDRKKGLLLALGSAILYGLSPVLGRIFASIFEPFFISFILGAVVCFYFGILIVLKKDLLKYLYTKEIVWVGLIGTCAAIGSLFAFTGLSLVKATSASFFFQFETFFAALLAYLILKEKLTTRQIKGLLLMAIGGVLFAAPFSYGFQYGNLFFIGSAFVWAINDVIVRNKLKHFSPLFLAFGRNFVSAIMLFPFALQFFPREFPKVTSPIFGELLLYGLIVAGTILFLYKSFSYIKIAEATSFQILSPLITVIIASIFLAEGLQLHEVIGGMTILTGILLMSKVKIVR